MATHFLQKIVFKVTAPFMPPYISVKAPFLGFILAALKTDIYLIKMTTRFWGTCPHF
jgi:hypothetical protein